MIHYGDYQVQKQVFTPHGLGRIESINSSPTGLVTFNVNIKGVVYNLAYNQINIQDVFTNPDEPKEKESIPDNIRDILKFGHKEADTKSIAEFNVNHIKAMCEDAMENLEKDVLQTITYMKRVLATIQIVENKWIKKTYIPLDVDRGVENIFNNKIDSDGSYNYARTVILKLKNTAKDIEPNTIVRMDIDVYTYIKKWATGKKSLTKWYCESARFFKYDMCNDRVIDKEEYHKIIKELE